MRHTHTHIAVLWGPRHENAKRQFHIQYNCEQMGRLLVLPAAISCGLAPLFFPLLLLTKEQLGTVGTAIKAQYRNASTKLLLLPPDNLISYGRPSFHHKMTRHKKPTSLFSMRTIKLLEEALLCRCGQQLSSHKAAAGRQEKRA